MVMHARKHPRLNDGYYERNEAHPYQDMDKYPSKSSYNDRGSYDKVRESPGYKQRDKSPSDRPSPRYHNKQSYIEKAREKLEKGANNRSPIEKKLNSVICDKGSYHTISSVVDRNHKDPKDGREIKNQKEKDVRAEVQKSALRVFGDWSEHISSSGKRYYYNCRTEVSQWEKPKQWDDSMCTKNVNRSRERERHGSTSHTSEEGLKHSTGGERQVDKGYPTSLSSSSKLLQHQQPHNVQQQYRTRHDSEHSQKGFPSEHSSSSSLYKGGQTPNRLERRDGDRGRSISHNGSGRLSVDNRKTDSEDSKQLEDMDISPINSTSALSNSQHCHSVFSNNTGVLPPVSSSSSTYSSSSALPQLLTQVNDRALQNLNSQELHVTQQALQTLQKLQQALSRQANLAQNITNQSPRSTTSDITSPNHHTLKSPPVNNALRLGGCMEPPKAHTSDPRLHTPAAVVTAQGTTADLDGAASPLSEKSFSSSRGGESPISPDSSQDVQSTSLSSSLAAAALKPTTCTIELAPSLAVYYDERLITHVSGWPADACDREADRFCVEAHNVGSIQSTKISTELKKARSFVRIAEIQATLQEQRILFLRQQIRELETMKTQNSFMSS